MSPKRRSPVKRKTKMSPKRRSPVKRKTKTSPKRRSPVKRKTKTSPKRRSPVKRTRSKRLNPPKPAHWPTALTREDRARLQNARNGLQAIADECASKKAEDPFCRFLRMKNLMKNISDLDDEELKNLIIDIAIGEGNSKTYGDRVLFNTGLNIVETRTRLYQQGLVGQLGPPVSRHVPQLRDGRGGGGGRGDGRGGGRDASEDRLIQDLQMLRDKYSR